MNVITSTNEKISKILTGSTIVMGGSLLSRILEFSTRTVAANVMGPMNFGIFSSAISLIALMGTFLLLGLPMGIVKFVNESENKYHDEYSNVAFWFSLLISSSVSFLLLIFDKQLAGLILGNRDLAIVIRTVVLGLPFFVSLSMISGIFQAYKNAEKYTIVNNIILPGARLAGILLLSWVGLYSISIILNIYLIWIPCLALSIALFFIRKHSLFVLKPHLGYFKILNTLLKFSFPLLLGSLLSSTIWQLDVVLLQRYSG